MAEFNPYQAWLQVPVSAGETPTYYKLLGLPEFEENPQAISKAAEKQLSRLLAIKPEKHRPQWQKLINDLAEAQSTLTHPQHKANYDNRLRGVTTPAEETATAQPSSSTASQPSSTAPQPSRAPAAVTPVTAQPYQAPAPQAPALSPDQGYPAYAQPSYPNPNFASPVAAQPQYAQPVYPQPGFGQPSAAPYAQPYSPPQYAQPVYGQPVQAQPVQAQPVQAQPVQAQPVYAQPVYGQPAYAQPVLGQPAYAQPVPPSAPPAFAQPVFNAAPASPAQPFGFTQAASPVFEATPAHDPFQPAGMPNPMAPVGASSGFGSIGGSAPGAFTTAIDPMSPMNNSRSPLPGTSQNFVEEDSSFGAPVVKPTVYRAKPQESPVKYIVMAAGLLVVIIGALVLNSVLGSKKTNDAPVAQIETPAPAKKGKATPEVVPVSTPADPRHTEPKHTEPKHTEPMPAHAEPMKPATPKPEPKQPEPPKPMPEMPKPEPPKPEVKKPEPKPEPPKPMPAPMPAKASPDERRTIVAKLAEARKLIGERKFSEAKRVLKETGELAKTPDVQDLHEGMELVLNYNEQFWKAVKESMRTASGEITIGSTPANIVASDADEITIRIPGRNNTYKFDELSSKAQGLAIALADRWFDKNPANLAAKASFQFVRKNANLEEARTLLNAAQSGGVDTKFILLLLDEPAVLGN